MKKLPIIKILEKNQSMSKPEDIYIESKILSNEMFNNCSILELGTGLAGWPLSLHYLGVNNKKWTLVDNLAWFKDNEHYIDNIKEKMKILNGEFIELEINDIARTKSHLDNKKFDVIRIDCNINEDIIDFIVTKCTNENTLFFIDDIIPSWGFTRVYLMFYLMMKYNFQLTWVGTNQCLLVKSEEIKNKILYELEKILKNENVDFVFLHKMSEKFSMLYQSKTINYVSTTGFFLRKN